MKTPMDTCEKLAKENQILRDALEVFLECNLTHENCASFEVANRRIRRLARIALDKANGTP